MINFLSAVNVNILMTCIEQIPFREDLSNYLDVLQGTSMQAHTGHISLQSCVCSEVQMLCDMVMAARPSAAALSCSDVEWLLADPCWRLAGQGCIKTPDCRCIVAQLCPCTIHKVGISGLLLDVKNFYMDDLQLPRPSPVLLAEVSSLQLGSPGLYHDADHVVASHFKPCPGGRAASN